MILFIIITLIYLGFLLFIKPAPGSLKAQPLTFSENFNLIKASMFSGVLLLVVFLLTSNFGFITVDENIYSLLALNNDIEQSSYWPLQSLTHLFIHENLIHLLLNVSAIGLASVYERRVGARRFFAVLCVAGIASVPSILFYSEMSSVCGISGGVMGLAAAYFTDEKELSAKEWGVAILLFFALAIMLALQAEFKNETEDILNIRVDHIGHLLGAIAAIIYCRLRPQHSCQFVKVDND